jgi:hypothetical protein
VGSCKQPSADEGGASPPRCFLPSHLRAKEVLEASMGCCIHALHTLDLDSPRGGTGDPRVGHVAANQRGRESARSAECAMRSMGRGGGGNAHFGLQRPGRNAGVLAACCGAPHIHRRRGACESYLPSWRGLECIREGRSPRRGGASNAR